MNNGHCTGIGLAGTWDFGSYVLSSWVDDGHGYKIRLLFIYFQPLQREDIVLPLVLPVSYLAISQLIEVYAEK